MLTHTILFYFGSEMKVSEISELNEKGIITSIANTKGMGLFALVFGIIFTYVSLNSDSILSLVAYIFSLALQR